MKRIRPLFGVLLLLSVLAIGTSSVATATGSRTAVLRTARNATFGTILVAPTGKTLYHFSLDRNGTIGCRGTCLQFWFPLRVPRGVRVPAHLAGISGKLSTINRGGGVLQVTYRGHPLYTFVSDGSAGQITGQGIRSFGGVWSIATAKAAAGSTSTGGNTGGYGMW